MVYRTYIVGTHFLGVAFLESLHLLLFTFQHLIPDGLTQHHRLCSRPVATHTHSNVYTTLNCRTENVTLTQYVSKALNPSYGHSLAATTGTFKSGLKTYLFSLAVMNQLTLTLPTASASLKLRASGAIQIYDFYYYYYKTIRGNNISKSDMI